ncbi:DNA repair protein RadA [Candidatus Parcubacteria bacterium]|nr:MAG: DNA repair protein RadA [Candidatus Parcubacteria bacterium]
MSKELKKIFSCNNCGAQFPKWSGRCLECGTWGSLEEEIASKKNTSSEKVEAIDLKNLDNIPDENLSRMKIGVTEVDRVFGGGIVPGSLILLSGEPGVGKSTILAQITGRVAKSYKDEEYPVIYISGEESAPQVKSRFKRLKGDLSKVFFESVTSIEKVVATAKKHKPKLLIIDSVQTVHSDMVPSETGSINQIRAVTVSLLELAKQNNISVIIVGHITKDGQVAGPKSLEHIVDAVINLEHDSSNQYRILRASKNRFGSVNEIGIFEMTAQGFVEIKNPSLAFASDENGQVSGSVVACIMEGSRPFMVEVQALVAKTVFGYPQRKASGYDLNRLQVLSAVLQKKAGLNLTNQDIIINIVGGLKVNDTSLDLAVCAAVILSLAGSSLKQKTLFIGEVGLGGEIRPVSRMNERVEEAKRLGFKEIYIPKNTKTKQGIMIDSLENLKSELI